MTEESAEAARRMVRDSSDDDTEGQMIRGDDSGDDTEGHRLVRGDDDGDDTEGHRLAH